MYIGPGTLRLQIRRNPHRLNGYLALQGDKNNNDSSNNHTNNDTTDNNNNMNNNNNNRSCRQEGC